jgi:hypothetical protein
VYKNINAHKIRIRKSKIFCINKDNLIHIFCSLQCLYISFNVFRSFAVSEWEGEVLELTRISRLDMGAYLCIASNGVPPTVSKRIKVSVDCKYQLCDVSLRKLT